MRPYTVRDGIGMASKRLLVTRAMTKESTSERSTSRSLHHVAFEALARLKTINRDDLTARCYCIPDPHSLIARAPSHSNHFMLTLYSHVGLNLVAFHSFRVHLPYCRLA